MAYAIAANCILSKYDDNKIELTLSTSHQAMLNSRLKERISEALNRYFKKNLQLEINMTQEAIATPFKQQEKEHNERLSQANQQVLNNPQIKRFIELYDAAVEVELIN